MIIDLSPQIYHYSTFFGATVLGEVLNICPYSSLGMDIEYWVVGGDQKTWNNDNMLSFAQQNLKYSLQTREKSSWKTIGGFATSGFLLGFFSCLSWIFVDTASRITTYCPNIWFLLRSNKVLHQSMDKWRPHRYPDEFACLKNDPKGTDHIFW